MKKKTKIYDMVLSFNDLLTLLKHFEDVGKIDNGIATCRIYRVSVRNDHKMVHLMERIPIK